MTSKSLNSYLAQSTSHGISNIFKYSRPYLKVTWVILSTSALIGFIVHSSLLIRQLQDEKVNTEILPSFNFIQPDIVFAFYRPFSMDFINIPPKNEYQKLSKISKTIKNVTEQMDHRNLQTLYLYDNIGGPQELRKVFFHREYQLVLKLICSSKKDKHINRRWEINFYFYSSLRVTPQDCPLENELDHLDAVFYMYIPESERNYPDKLDVSFGSASMDEDIPSIYMAPTMSDGVLIYFPQQNEHHSFMDRHVIAQGNAQTDIKVNAIKYKRLRRKEFLCKERLKYHTYYDPMKENIGKGGFLNYSEASLCRERNTQMCIYKQLKCVLSILPIPTTIPKNYTFCLALSKIKRNRTYEDYVFETFRTCRKNSHKNCSQEKFCSYVAYDMQTEKSQWPQTHLLKRLINSQLKDLISQNEQRNKSLPGLNETIFNVKNRPQEMEIWKSHFIKVCIRRGEQKMTEIVESFAYTFERLLSDIGGILGFYLGSSILTICEIFSIFADIFCKRAESRRHMTGENHMLTMT